MGGHQHPDKLWSRLTLTMQGASRQLIIAYPVTPTSDPRLKHYKAGTNAANCFIFIPLTDRVDYSRMSVCVWR